MSVEGKEIDFELINYLPSAQKELQLDPVNGKKALELMVSNGQGRGKTVHICQSWHWRKTRAATSFQMLHRVFLESTDYADLRRFLSALFNLRTSVQSADEFFP